MPRDIGEKDPLTAKVIGAAIEVHRHLGPGLLESAYEECLCWELAHLGLAVNRQTLLRARYKEITLNCGYRIDAIVENQLILELKTVDAICAVHEAQLLTYLKLSGLRTGLIINFNVSLLKDGIVRMVN